MYAYQCGQYELCLLMSEQNVNILWHQNLLFEVPIFGCMTQMMTDGVVSLQAIISLFGAGSWTDDMTALSQLTLSLDLIIEAKLKLNHSMTSLIEVLRLVKVLHSRLPIEDVHNRQMLSFIYRKTVVKLT
jgi:hypothetical protein